MRSINPVVEIKGKIENMPKSLLFLQHPKIPKKRVRLGLTGFWGDYVNVRDFLGQTFFRTFLPKRFFTKPIFYQKDFLPNRFFTTKIFYQNYFLPKKFFTKKFRTDIFSNFFTKNFFAKTFEVQRVELMCTRKIGMLKNPTNYKIAKIIPLFRPRKLALDRLGKFKHENNYAIFDFRVSPFSISGVNSRTNPVIIFCMIPVRFPDISAFKQKFLER